MFELLLSDASRARMDQRDAEILRLYGLDRRWLAEAIYALGRRARGETGYQIADRHYGSALLWLVIPELAYRLGRRTERLPNEYDAEIRTMTGAALREYVYYCIANTPDRTDAGQITPSAMSLLVKEPANGNPLVFAVDRIAPGDTTHPDILTKSLMEIARLRGTSYAGIWTPDIMIKRPADTGLDDEAFMNPFGSPQP